jgi:hypothetical protein
MYKHLLKIKNNNIGVLFTKESSLSRHLDRSFSLGNFNRSINLNKENAVGYRENFAYRHIGVDEQNEKAMLKALKLNVN